MPTIHTYLNVDLEVLASEARQAIEKLNGLKYGFNKGVLSYKEVLASGEPHVKVYNKYAKALAKERKMPYKPITIGYFLR